MAERLSGFFEAYNWQRGCWKFLKKEDIHLVLMDIMMPEMDGITAMLKIREVSNVPVILLTAKARTPIRCSDLPWAQMIM